MTLVRPNVYRLVVDERVHPRERKAVCIEFFLAQGCPSACVWVETNVPDRWDSVSGEWKPARVRVDEAPKTWVYGRSVLDKKRVTAADMEIYTMAEALARDGVVGESASRLAHAVLWGWFINGPVSRHQYLAEAAPEWWERIAPKKRRKEAAA